mmetsp:Transcript_91512/g.218148  ORF Transcript_91512/g.218148 Transcript_91512/m.218148 type:complete len:219 (-) Transcript_91512:1193-1849(-)
MYSNGFALTRTWHSVPVARGEGRAGNGHQLWQKAHGVCCLRIRGAPKANGRFEGLRRDQLRIARGSHDASQQARVRVAEGPGSGGRGFRRIAGLAAHKWGIAVFAQHAGGTVEVNHGRQVCGLIQAARCCCCRISVGPHLSGQRSQPEVCVLGGIVLLGRFGRLQLQGGKGGVRTAGGFGALSLGQLQAPDPGACAVQQRGGARCLLPLPGSAGGAWG